VLVSVIIPTFNESQNIEQCVAAARGDYSPEEVEIIVADGGSTDGTLNVVPADVTVVHAPTGRGVQMNCGADAAHGEIFVFCHADSRLPPGWREQVVSTLRKAHTSGGAFQTRYEPQRGLLLGLINHLKFPADWRVIHGDRAQFMTSSVFLDIGGFPQIPLMEDVEMARSLHRRGKLRLISSRVVTSSRRYLELGSVKYFLSVMRNVLNYLYFGATPEEIERVYKSSRETAMEPEEQEREGVYGSGSASTRPTS
jgi:rSAM/selenodomain-associated transferase 2